MKRLRARALRSQRRSGTARECDRGTEMSGCWVELTFAKHNVKTKRVFADRVTDRGGDHFIIAAIAIQTCSERGWRPMSPPRRRRFGALLRRNFIFQYLSGHWVRVQLQISEDCSLHTNRVTPACSMTTSRMQYRKSGHSGYQFSLPNHGGTTLNAAFVAGGTP